jgi:Bacterial membrane protein YfhO
MNYFKKFLPHLVAIAIFAIICMIYFSPVLEGKKLVQMDVSNAAGMQKENADFKALTGEQTLWTNSMFGGMPMYQIGLEYKGNFAPYLVRFVAKIFPAPMNYVFLYLIGFYFLLLILRVNKWLAIVGAIAFSFSTYNFIIIEVGHISKAYAIAFIPPLFGGIILAYHGKFILGAAIAALFTALELSVNHFQMTYYFLFILLSFLIVQFIDALQEKKLMQFIKASLFLFVAALIGVLCNIGNIYNTYDYSKYTTRGSSELTIMADGSKNDAVKTNGLDRDYITQYSYGIEESFSFLVPDAKGGAPSALGNDKSLIAKANPQFRDNLSQSNHYWGDLPSPAPAYFGAIAVFLFVMGMIYLNRKIKWAFLASLVVMVMLSWGKNFMGFTNFFLDYFPGYDKFRAVSSILCVAGIVVPILGILFFDKFLKEPSIISSNFKKFYIAAGSFIAVLILIFITPSSFFEFFSLQEIDMFGKQIESNSEQASMIQNFIDSLKEIRIGIFKADLLRSLFFIGSTMAIIWLFAKEILEKSAAIIILGSLVLIDMWPVNKRYFNNEKVNGKYTNWVDPEQSQVHFTASKADKDILIMETAPNPGLQDKIVKAVELEKVKIRTAAPKYKEELLNKVRFGILNLNSNYRVLKLGNPFSDASISYYHKSIGGYHGAKLKKYQELIDFSITPEMNRFIDAIKKNPSQDSLMIAYKNLPVLNMLNTKYIVYNESATPLINPSALGNAWFVKSIKKVGNADEEILALKQFDSKNEAIVQNIFSPQIDGFSFQMDSAASIKLKEYNPNHLTYESSSTVNQLAVFSEIYYADGWNVYIDEKKSDYFRANYVLRAMKIPPGKHTIEFKFEPQIIQTTNKIAAASSILLILLVLGSIYFEVKNRKSPILSSPKKS